MSRANLFRLLALLVLIGGVVALTQLSVRDRAQELFDGIATLGIWGPVLLAAIYIPASVLLVPASALTLGAGFTFGIVTGTIAVSVGSTTGAAAAFLVGRFLTRPWVERWVSREPRFQAIDRALGGNGFKIVLLARLSPILPFNVLNYAFGISRVRFRDFVLASWIGMLPGTLMYIYLGSAARELARNWTDAPERTTATTAFFLFGLVATVVGTILVVRIASKALTQAIAAADTNPPPKL